MFAVEQGLESRAASGAQDDALERAGRVDDGWRADAATAQIQRASCGVRSRPGAAGDIVEAGQCLRSTRPAEDETNAQAFHVLAMALERMGHLHKALVTYERAFELDPDDPDLLINLGLDGLGSQADRCGDRPMFRRFIAARPESPLGYNNLGTMLCELGERGGRHRHAEWRILRMPRRGRAVEFACDGAGRRPDAPKKASSFTRKPSAWRRNCPRPGTIWAIAYQHLGQLEEALAAYDQRWRRGGRSHGSDAKAAIRAASA